MPESRISDGDQNIFKMSIYFSLVRRPVTRCKAPAPFDENHPQTLTVRRPLLFSVNSLWAATLGLTWSFCKRRETLQRLIGSPVTSILKEKGRKMENKLANELKKVLMNTDKNEWLLTCNLLGRSDRLCFHGIRQHLILRECHFWRSTWSNLPLYVHCFFIPIIPSCHSVDVAANIYSATCAALTPCCLSPTNTTFSWSERFPRSRRNMLPLRLIDNWRHKPTFFILH